MMTKQHATAWVDGILIKPQHFEQQERALHYRLLRSLNYMQPYSWGIDALVTDPDLLAQSKIQFTALSGCFQDGTIFELEATMLAHLSLDIDEPIANEVIYLGLPTNDFISEQADMTKRFVLEEIEATDTLTPTEPATPILVRQLNLSLLRSEQNRESYLQLPILKIKKADPEAGITLDENFIPPSLNVNSNTNLSRDLQAMLLLIRRKQKQLGKTVVSPLQSRTITSTTDIALLQVLNRYLVQLTQLKALPVLHPYLLYQTYTQLLAELGTFYRQDRLAIEIETYQPQKLQEIFSLAKHQLVHILQTKFEHQATEIALTQQAGIYQAKFEDASLLINSTIILSIRHNDQSMRDKIAAHIKIAANDELANIIRLQLSGVKCKTLNLVPPQLPYYEDALYLQLNKKGQRWESIAQQQSLSIFLGKTDNVTPRLWAIPELDNNRDIGGDDD